MRVEKRAELSSCGEYRYRLTRVWDSLEPRCVFVMLNPSTADHEQDDPTIRKCMGFAKRMEFGSIDVLNLFALRSPNPKDLMNGSRDPVGELNSMWFEWVMDDVSSHNREDFGTHCHRGDVPIICAWGSHGGYMDQDQACMAWIEKTGLDFQAWCLGLTKHGHPRHPLYVPYSCGIRLFEFQ